MAKTFTDLPMDVSSQIICAVAKSHNGALIVAHSMRFSRYFLEASKNNAILKAVCFENVCMLGRTHLFQSRNGLLYKCAKVGNPSAVHLLAKVILATSEHLLKINIKKEKPKSSRGKACKHGVAALFMARFKPKPGSKITNSDSPVPSFHWEFVKAFMLKCTQHEILQMKPYIKAYLTLFLKHSHQIFGYFWYFVRLMCMLAKDNENLMLAQRSRDNYINWTHVNTSPFEVVVDLSHAETAFEDLRAKTLEKFEGLIPKLRGRRL